MFFYALTILWKQKFFLSKMIKAVIFDLDGVLVAAKDWHYEALNKALKIFGCEINYKDHLNVFDGLPTKKKLQILNRQKNFPLELSELVNELKQIYTHEIFLTKCFPNFTLLYLFKKLKKKKIKIAVASNSIKATVDQAMKSLNLKYLIDFSLSSEDVTNPKPDPEIYLKSISMLDCRPDECLIVEDNFNGIVAAKASGAHCLEVKEVEDVNHVNIFNKIKSLES